MRAEELRIGNCVHFDMNNPREDNEPEQGYVDHIITAKDLNDKETIERLTPIPLTGEWLLKFGELQWLYKDNVGYYVLIHSKRVYIKFVHSLQNIYFCIYEKDAILKY